jgi:tetratricopeptide (TPR) repeat protein
MLMALAIPASALGPSNQSAGSSNKAYTVNSTTALRLLQMAERLANYTATKLNGAPESAVELYQNATTYLNEAWEFYNEGNYTKAVELVMNAMNAYREVLVMVTPEENETNSTTELVKRAYVEIGITQQALQYAERVMEQLRESGVNYTDLEERYELTLNATKRVEADLKGRNYSALQKDLNEMVKARNELNSAVEDSMKKVVERRSKELVKMQLKMLEGLMKEIPQNTTDPALKGQLMLLKAMESELQQVMEENNPQMALEMLKSLRAELERTIKMIKRERGIEPGRPGIGRENETAPPASVITNGTATNTTKKGEETKPKNPGEGSSSATNTTKNEGSGGHR